MSVKKRAAIVLQCRVGSRRFPKRAFADVAGATLFTRCVRRLQRAGLWVILATTDRSEDSILAVIASELGAAVLRGPEEDVLDRYLRVARRFDVMSIIRATGDSPCVDPGASLRTLSALTLANVDYAVEDGLPDGVGVEAVTASALARAAAASCSTADRQDVTALIRRDRGFSRVVTPAPSDLYAPDMSLRVRTQNDLDFVNRAWTSTGKANPSVADLIAAARDLTVGSAVA